MATTCKLIAKNVLSGTATSVAFSDIPATYTDLLVVHSARTDRSSFVEDYIKISFNGVTTNRSMRSLYGLGTSGGSGTDTDIYTSIGAAGSTSSTFGNGFYYIPNYAGSTNKSVSGESVQETNASSAVMYIVAGLWSSTAAITTVTLTPYYGPNFISGSSFFLYGITKA